MRSQQIALLKYLNRALKRIIIASLNQFHFMLYVWENEKHFILFSAYLSFIDCLTNYENVSIFFLLHILKRNERKKINPISSYTNHSIISLYLSISLAFILNFISIRSLTHSLTHLFIKQRIQLVLYILLLGLL